MAKETVRESYYLENFTPTGQFIEDGVIAIHKETGQKVVASRPFASMHCVTRVIRPLDEAMLATG